VTIEFSPVVARSSETGASIRCTAMRDDRGPTVDAAPFETQGERRRAQLVAVTAHLIVTKGVDSVSHSNVAEAAGCTRTLVYHYFPTRESLLQAVPAAYAKVYSERISTEEAAASIRAATTARRGNAPAATRRLAERIWPEEDWNQTALELRLALLVLVTDRDVAREIHGHEGTFEPLTNSELAEPLRQLGFTEIEVAIVRDTMLAGYYRTVVAALNGSISRAEAIELTSRVNRTAVQMFLR
jgi:AcrR family transcriptional regulator